MDKRILNPEELTYEGVNENVEVAKLDFKGCEAKVFHYKKGYEIPAHRHTSETLKVILKGEIKFEDGDASIGLLYKCGGWEYRGIVIKDTYILLLQEPGTEVIWSESED